MSKENRKHGKKRYITIGICAAVFGITSFGAYKLTPARVVKSEITLNRPNNNSQNEQNTSYFGQFASKITNAVDDNDEYLGLNGTFNDFVITYPSKDGLLTNTIKVDGDLNVVMNSLNDLDLTIDLDLLYNNKSIDLALGFVDQDVYFALNDLKIKSSYDNSMDILDYVYDCFFEPENENGLGIDLDIQELIGGLVGKIDLSSFDLGSISATETEVGENVVIDLSIQEIAIELTVRKDDLALRKVDLGQLNIGETSISGSIDFNVIDRVLKLDDPEYPKQRGEFVEVISYISWVDDLLDLFQTRKLGLDLDAQISLLDGDNKSLLADVSSKIDLNCAEVFDFNNLKINEIVESVSNSTFEVSSLFDLDKLEFGVDLETRGQQDEVYANLNLAYFNEAAYLTLNEKEDDAVMRAKINNQTLSQILNVTPNLVDAIDNLKVEDLPKKEIKDASDDIFGFVTDSKLVKAIKNNDFSGIIDMIKNISNDGSKIYLDVDLSSLGLGDNAEVNLVLNAAKGDGQKILSIDVSNVIVSNVEINVSLNASKFSSVGIDKVKAKKDTYDDLSFIPGIITQASDILNEKKGKLVISGSVLDANNEGVVINGDAQFDANENVGYGSLNLRQYGSDIVNSNKYIDHKIDFDINNKGNVNANKNALFVYNSELKAKVTIQTFVDIIDLAKDLLNSDDERFTKFKDLLSESLITGALNDIINNKDYLLIAKASFIKSIKQENAGNTIRIVVSGDLLGMESDVNLCINFKDVDGNKKLSGISVSGLELKEKAVELEINLTDFDESYVSKVNKNDNFMDFSQVKVLLDFGINTTKINYYHLTANASLKLSVLKAFKVNLDFHIHVDGKKTRVYGSIPDVPWVTDIGSAHLGWDSVDSEFVFEPTEDIGGTFHIVKNKNLFVGKDTVNYYQSDSDNFLENIVTYLMVDMLDIRENISDSLTSSTVSTKKDYDPDFAKMFTSTGFKYSKNESTGINTWNIGLNMNKLLGNNTLGALEVELKGEDLEKSGLFKSAHVELGVASILTVVADIKLENPSFEVETWPTDIEKKYNNVLNWYNNLSDSKKADFDANYKNNPLKPYKMVEKSGYF